METHTLEPNRNPTVASSDQDAELVGSSPEREFAPGSPVIYGLHGRCSVVAVETRQVGQESIRCYKLEIQKSALSRSNRQDPAIWLPVNSARARGLRAPVSREESGAVFGTLSSREYFFPVNEPWSAVHSKIESTIRAEGAVGLAKALSYLHVLRRKQIVPATEVVRFHESVSKLLIRELSEATGEPPRSLEERINKSLRQKLVPDN